MATDVVKFVANRDALLTSLKHDFELVMESFELKGLKLRSELQSGIKTLLEMSQMMKTNLLLRYLQTRIGEFLAQQFSMIAIVCKLENMNTDSVEEF